MATKKKNPMALTQKARKIMKGDIARSVAVTSILLNLLFLVSIFVITSTDTFDRRVYTSARDRYCANKDATKERAKELGDKNAAVREKQIDCIDTDFQPFYKEAVDKYRAQTAE
ncbi:MAG: hypothetical protein U0520_04920 [Candidatus Saccharimonadales bacterium]